METPSERVCIRTSVTVALFPAPRSYCHHVGDAVLPSIVPDHAVAGLPSKAFDGSQEPLNVCEALAVPPVSTFAPPMVAAMTISAKQELAE
jgi:hypothetical protein